MLRSGLLSSFKPKLYTNSHHTSCSKDDDEFSHEIVGTWLDTRHPDSKLIFRADKTGSTIDIEDDLKIEMIFDYTVDDEKGELTVTTTEAKYNGTSVPLSSVGFDKEPIIMPYSIKDSKLLFDNGSDGIYERQ